MPETQRARRATGHRDSDVVVFVLGPGCWYAQGLDAEGEQHHRATMEECRQEPVVYCNVDEGAVAVLRVL